jgi:CRP-like cAMP-binding protein
MDVMHLLSCMPLFTGLSKGELHMVAQITKRQQYARHQVIIKASERGTAFFLLTKGIVRVSVEGSHGREVILGVLYPHDFFGEMAILDGLPRSATVTAMEETEVLVISRKDFLECIRQVPQVATKMIVTLSLRLRRTDQKVGILAFVKAPGELPAPSWTSSTLKVVGPRTASPSISSSHDGNWRNWQVSPAKRLLACSASFSTWESSWSSIENSSLRTYKS